MAKKLEKAKERESQRPERAQLSAEESLQRMKEFDKRKEQFVAAVGKGKNRSVSP